MPVGFSYLPKQVNCLKLTMKTPYHYRGRSRNDATSKMELFVIIVNAW